MPVAVTSTYNNSFHSPGFDLAVNGLTGYDTLTIERVSVSGAFRDTPVRGASAVPIASSLFGLTDYEGPANDATFYRATASTKVYFDDFDRTVSSGFGTGPLGLVWNVVGGAPSEFSSTFADGATITPSAVGGAVRRATLSGLSMADFDIILPVKTTALAAGSDIVGSLATNFVDGNNYYPWEVHYLTTGFVQIQMRKIVGGTNTLLASTTTSVSYTAAASLVFIRCQRSGNQMMMKAWTGTVANEPATWNLTFNDASLGTGVIGLQGFLNVGNTNTLPVSLSYANIQIKTPSGGPVYTSVATSATATINATDAGTVWLKSVGAPSLSRRVNMIDFDDVSRPGRVLGEYEVLGREKKVVITDSVMSGREGSFTVATFPSGGTWWNDSFWRDLQTLLTKGGVLLLQTAGFALTGEDDMYLVVKDIGKKRVGVVGGELVHLHTIEYVEVDRPALTNQVVSLRTWQDVINQNATWSAVLTNHTTWLDVLQRNL